jgi:2-succinyl-6-hydroxy-2,4-cyclohexadiene-1-carboxylate synthase
MTVVNVLGVPHVYDFTPSAQLAESPGQVIVCVHGWLLSRAYWQPVTQKLAPRYSCLTYDLRGFGDSTQGLHQRLPPDVKDARGNPATLYSLAAYAEDLIALLHQLGIQRAWLLGHSLGGSIALWAAHLAPDCIQGVICLNAGGGIYIRNAFEQFRAAGQQMVRYRARWLQYLPLMATVFSRLMMAHPVAIQWGKRRLIDFLNANGEAALGALLASTTPLEVNRLPQVVASLSQPVYFITGQQDTVMQPRYVTHLASFHPLFSQGNVTEFEHCGHFAMLEKPQQVVKLIDTVLEHHGK